jgi:hypothetical protein
MHHFNGTDITQDLSEMTKQEIIDVGAPIKFGRADMRIWSHLIETVSKLLPNDQSRIHRAAIAKRHQFGTEIINDEHVAKHQKTMFHPQMEPHNSTQSRDSPCVAGNGEFLKCTIARSGQEVHCQFY